MRRLVEGRQVQLEYDVNRLDAYGRTLAYVQLEDGRVLNKELVLRGLARAYTRFPFSEKDRYVELERRARQRRLGLWANEERMETPIRGDKP